MFLWPSGAMHTVQSFAHNVCVDIETDLLLQHDHSCCNKFQFFKIEETTHTTTVTSQWTRWRLKSPALPLFTQPLIQAQIKENSKAPRHWPLCGEFAGTGEFPAQMVSSAENVSIWWRHHAVTGCRLCVPGMIYICFYRQHQPLQSHASWKYKTYFLQTEWQYNQTSSVVLSSERLGF